MSSVKLMKCVIVGGTALLAVGLDSAGTPAQALQMRSDAEARMRAELCRQSPRRELRHLKQKVEEFKKSFGYYPIEQQLANDVEELVQLGEKVGRCEFTSFEWQLAETDKLLTRWEQQSHARNSINIQFRYPYNILVKHLEQQGVASLVKFRETFRTKSFNVLRGSEKLTWQMILGDKAWETLRRFNENLVNPWKPLEKSIMQHNGNLTQCFVDVAKNEYMYQTVQNNQSNQQHYHHGQHNHQGNGGIHPNEQHYHQVQKPSQHGYPAPAQYWREPAPQSQYYQWQYDSWHNEKWTPAAHLDSYKYLAAYVLKRRQGHPSWDRDGETFIKQDKYNYMYITTPSACDDTPVGAQCYMTGYWVNQDGSGNSNQVRTVRITVGNFNGDLENKLLNL